MLIGSLLLTSEVASPLTAAAAAEKSSAQPAAAVTASAAPADTEHVALRDAIWRLERSLRQRLTRVSRIGSRALPGDVETDELAQLVDVLRSSAGRLVAAEGSDLARKASALRPLLHELENRERAIDATASPASPWEPGSAKTVIDAGAAAACAAAIDVVDGSYRATIRRQAGGTGAEVWLRYTAKVAGMAVVSTAGSDFDTVVDWFDTCPGSGPTARAHGDDEIGLQARAATRVSTGESTWIRIRGFEQSTGTATIRIEGSSAGISGTVTNEATGQALSSRFVELWSVNGSWVGSDYTAGDGSYLIVGLDPGTYYASTETHLGPDGFLDELYANKPCAGGVPHGCSPMTGTPIAVQNGAVTNGIDFALGHGAAITGRVRQASTGAALPFIEVEVYGPSGGLVGVEETDQAGRFLVTGLATGNVFAVASDDHYSEYRRELYQNLSCVPGCNVTRGTSIPVTNGQTTAGVDFDLERLGVVTGTVTQAPGGLPLAYERVEILDAKGFVQGSDYTDAAGVYVVGGLNAETYFARTVTFGSHLDEVYDDVPCGVGCNVADGTPLVVALDATRAGIDFALQRMGSISGELTDATSGDRLLGDSYLYAYNAAGVYMGFGSTYDGSYTISGLPSGTYHVYASHWPYRAELYDDIPCHPSCDPNVGAPVSVALDADTPGIDFALTPLGRISGTITDARTHTPLSGIRLHVRNGAPGAGSDAYTSDAGNYLVQGLAPGSWFVVAESSDFVAELYDDIPCPGGPPSGCNLANGTSVAVSLDTTTSGIDFTLVRKGSIAGAVRDGITSAPLPHPYIVIYNSAGMQVRYSYGGENGAYEVNGLEAGTYYVVGADPSYSYEAELYNNLPCPSVGCIPTAGTPVVVTLDAVTSGIDFTLSRKGVIRGQVTDGSGEPLSYAWGDLYDSLGQFRGDFSTDAQGRYELQAESGTWYLVAYAGSDFVPELYSGIPCSGSCDVTSGAPVVVTSGSVVDNVDFALAFARGIVGQVSDHGHPLVGVAIDLWNAAGAHVAATVTGPSGWYGVRTTPGTYFVSTDSGMGAIEELWNDVPCPLGPAYAGLCDPTTGTPVTVANSTSLVSGVDFALERVQLFVNGFEPGGHGWSAKWPP